MNDQIFDGFECLLPQSQRVLPSYNNVIGRQYGELTIKRLLRKNNRNILQCECSCGNKQFLYRWQLKYKLSCTICGKYTQQYIDMNSEFDKKYYNNLKKAIGELHVSYSYLNKLLKKQNHRCVFSGKLLYTTYDKINCQIDLIQPQKGYEKGNIQLVTTTIKEMKQNLSNKQFIKLCSKIAKKQNNFNEIEDNKIF